jgi:Zinc finger, C2H2 type
MGPFKNELTVVTGYSERPIFEILGEIKFVSQGKIMLIILFSFVETFTETKLTRETLNTAGVCQNCFIKFNEYDEHQMMANIIQNDLLELHRASNAQRDVKTNIKVEAEDFIYEGYENVVEIVDEHNFQDISSTEVPRSKALKIQLIETAIQVPTKYQRKTLKERSPRKVQEPLKAQKDTGLVVVLIDGIKHYRCEFCHKDFPSRSRLKTHQMIHTSERNFICQTCGSSFKTMNCLKNHTRLHNNVFYNCDLCTSRFKGKHELRCHIDAIHLKKKDHVCQICGKAFSRDKTLRQHLMYHVNERNIVCEVCGFKTVNRPKMTRHMKSHTGERNYEVKSYQIACLT